MEKDTIKEVIRWNDMGNGLMEKEQIGLMVPKRTYQKKKGTEIKMISMNNQIK